jgi:hypothetical protein
MLAPLSPPTLPTREALNRRQMTVVRIQDLPMTAIEKKNH